MVLVSIQFGRKAYFHDFSFTKTRQTMPMRLIFSLLPLLLAGCASFINDSKQTIYVQTWCGDVSVKATCEAENGKGRQTFSTPAQIMVERDVQGLRISCRDSRARTTVSWVSPLPDIAMAGNVLLGGLLGASMDVANARGVAYPARININGPACPALVKLGAETPRPSN